MREDEWGIGSKTLTTPRWSNLGTIRIAPDGKEYQITGTLWSGNGLLCYTVSRNIDELKIPKEMK